MLRQLRKFIGIKKNRDLVSWLGGGAVVIVAGTWTLFTYLVAHDDKKSGAPTVTVVDPSGPVIAPARDAVFNAPVNFGLDEKNVAERVADAQRPLADQLEKLATQVTREKGIPRDVLVG